MMSGTVGDTHDERRYESLTRALEEAGVPCEPARQRSQKGVFIVPLAANVSIRVRVAKKGTSLTLVENGFDSKKLLKLGKILEHDIEVDTKKYSGGERFHQFDRPVRHTGDQDVKDAVQTLRSWKERIDNAIAQKILTPAGQSSTSAGATRRGVERPPAATSVSPPSDTPRNDFHDDDQGDVSALESGMEGAPQSRFVTTFERDPRLRAEAIRRHGVTCTICEFNFGEFYGAAGEGYIHVHHVVPVSNRGGRSATNVATDLVPVCANCHAIIHRHRESTLTIEEMEEHVRANGRWDRTVRRESSSRGGARIRARRRP